MIRLTAGIAAAVICSGPALAARPNVVLIMSDDQGNGDYGFRGNDLIRTPELDRLRDRSGLLNHFYVSPVCAPTRASLMTGRYNYRTRCIDTYIGRAMMDTAEITLAEFLRGAGYRTGIYGKWHLGDNYPLRPMDQGFEESLVHRGGGIGQPSDPFGAERKYTDPTLIHNGREVPMKGYCTDIYFDAAMSFIENSHAQGKSFFTYIATNAPHGPFHDVPPELYEEYRKVDFSSIMVGKRKEKGRGGENDKLARIAAMITNIDQNVGRLMKKLDALDVADNTIVMYLNDNGPNSMRYVGNMRGMKAGVDDGGIRSPLLFHWPGRVNPGMSTETMCAHIDVVPTVLEACGVEIPSDHQIDGRSFLPLLTKANPDWPVRQLVLQSHRGNTPQRFHHFALHEDPWKLVHPSGFGREKLEGDPKPQLYHLRDDPRQMTDLAEKQPEVFARLNADYEAWFDDVGATRPDNYAPPRIIIGTDHELRTVLTRQDWRHSSGRPWARDSNGTWLLEAPVSGLYQAELLFLNDHPGGTATFRVDGESTTVSIGENQHTGCRCTIELPAGRFSFTVDVDFGARQQGPHQVVLERE